MRHRMNQSGYTLIECLIVIAILAFLIGLLVPVVVGIRNSAVSISCMNNLRQVGMCCIKYAASNRGSLPLDGNHGERNPAKSRAWFYRLPKYADADTVRGKNSVFQCPGCENCEPELFDNASPKSYKMNTYLDAGEKGKPYQLGRRKRLERKTVLFIDAVAGETGMGQWGHCPVTAVDDSRHSGSANVLFLDCHVVKSEPPDDDNPDPRRRWEHLGWKIP